MADSTFNETESEDNNEELDTNRFHFPVTKKFSRPSGSKLLGLNCSDDEDEENEIYKLKYQKVKKIAKGLVFENACLCDEVSQLQEKILIAKEERRFLLRKFLNFEALKDKETSNQSSATSLASGSIVTDNSEQLAKKKNLAKKRPPPKSNLLNKGDNAKPRSKKKKPPAEKRMVQPIPLETSGRPLFPIVLGALKVHSLGVIVHDRPSFHDSFNIYPVGYCSSRTYISLKNPPHHCLYTCTILDSAFGPRFEMAPEDCPEQLLVSNSVNECHSLLLRAVNIICGKELLNTEGQGAKFFGLSHSAVQNLIQSSAGARKCADYRWINFEVSKHKEESSNPSENDPTINYDVLQTLLSKDTSQQL